MAFLESASSGRIRPKRSRKFASLIAEIVQLAFVMRRRPNPDSEANIRRIDTKPRAKKQTHGFQVHFIRGTQAVTKMFSDSVYGGRQVALRAARRFKRTAMAGLTKMGLASSTKSKRRSTKRPAKRRR